ncbi:DUF7310 family coiled-coil domain-containing protein [Halarchaeum salinum]|uniref:DUF7310 domain-containing protein n=1 Tax=Halarchaeum salinum TaxID=489912 RepID=A0AAV3S5V2_9EURY
MSTDFRADATDHRLIHGERADATDSRPTHSEHDETSGRVATTEHTDTPERDATTERGHAPDRTDVDARLRAVERAFEPAEPTPERGDDSTGGEPEHSASDTTDPTLDVRLAAVERRLDDLDAAVQSVQGYVGTLDAVNESVERRANAALAAAERPRPTHPLPDLPDPEPAVNDDDDPGFLARLVR